MIATRRLPGIRFETVTPPITEPLPRMDIVAFVGFAASGPLQRPLEVESYAEFTEIFGDDLPLVWDPVRNVTETAYLGPAVRGFFKNGGRRCWIVRVAGAGAAANTFALPGLYRRCGGNWDSALAEARSEGSWSDSVNVATVLSSRSVECAPAVAGTWLTVNLAQADEVVAGDLLRLNFPDAAVTMLAAVEEVDLSGGASVGAASVQVRDIMAAPSEAKEDIGAWQPRAALPAGRVLAERLSFELLVRDSASHVWRVDDLAFDATHPRFWATLPVDSALFRQPDNPTDPETTPLEKRTLWNEALNPRFPLAGPKARGAVYYPVGMGFMPGEPATATPAAAAPLERDGLASYEASLFLDDQLQSSSTRTLVQTADYLQYGSEVKHAPSGIYHGLRLEEATLIAVPDAVHTGWKKLQPGDAETPLAVPVPSPPLVRPEWWPFRDCRSTDPIPAAPQPEWNHFLPCGLRVIAPPVLTTGNPYTVDGFELSWTSAAAGVTYLLEEAADPAFTGTTVVYEGSDLVRTFPTHAQGDWFYRVRAVDGDVSSDYSNGVAVRVRRGYVRVDQESYQPGVLFDVQRALLRLCGARGDLFAVLDVPAAYRTRDVTNHVWQLRSSTAGPGETVAPLDGGEQDSFGYGALYHPWLVSREGAGPIDYTPPAGAMCGVYAARSIERGAWIAPANQPLRNLLALDPEIDSSDWQVWQDSQINLIRPQGSRITCWSEDTLGVDEVARPVHVRRLMQLIRRLAIRLGNTYVFEPNDDVLRRSVLRAFRSALQQMFQRGAFAGATPDESFFVRMPEAAALDMARDRGEFIVEIGVAPAAAMTFLTVRLLQLTDGRLVTNGV